MRIPPSHVLLAAFAITTLAACDRQEPKVTAPPASLRRLTESQYRTVVGDLFGSRIVIAGHFDPLLRSDGLQAVSTREAVITRSGLEQYDRMARNIALQVVSPANRDFLIPCTPESPQRPDDSCARRFFEPTGRLLYRRPLTPEELAEAVDLSARASEAMGDFYEGLGASLAAMLISPKFLFMADTTERAPSGDPRLTDYAKAARLSFFLWNSGPDETLLAAAGRGELNDTDGLTRQVDRMLASPFLERGVRAFFSDMLGLDEFDHLEKDSVIYPDFTLEVARDAREQILRNLVGLLVTEDGDYRDVFTSRRTYLSGPLARFYGVPVPRPDGGWYPYEYPQGDPRAGLVTQVGFTALHSHPGRSSPTIRGRAIREQLLCQKVPDPPGDVDFSRFNDPHSPNKTARERLSVHATAPVCAGCHKLTDPIGLGLEKIDGAGELRETENGAPILTAGQLDGRDYADAVGLGRALHDDPAAASCVVRRLYSYATGHAAGAGDRDVIRYFESGFSRDGYRIPRLLRRIATSEAFYAVSLPAAPRTVAQRSTTERTL